MVCSDSHRSFRYRSRNVKLGTHENLAGHKNKRKPGILPVFYGVDSKTIIFLRNVNSKFCFKRLVRRAFLSRPWILLFSHLFLADEIIVSVYTNQVFSFGLGDSTYAAQRSEEILKIASFTGLPDVGGLYEKSRTTRNRCRLEGINMFNAKNVLIIVINIRYRVFSPGVLLTNFGRPAFKNVQTETRTRKRTKHVYTVVKRCSKTDKNTVVGAVRMLSRRLVSELICSGSIRRYTYTPV